MPGVCPRHPFALAHGCRCRVFWASVFRPPPSPPRAASNPRHPFAYRSWLPPAPPKLPLPSTPSKSITRP